MFVVSIDILLFFCCVIGNSAVIFVIFRENTLKSKSSYYILSISVADLLVGLIFVPTNTVTVRKSVIFFANFEEVEEP